MVRDRPTFQIRTHFREDWQVSGTITYFIFFGGMLGVAAGMMFTLRAIKLI